jgi:hypothetical protein
METTRPQDVVRQPQPESKVTAEPPRRAEPEPIDLELLEQVGGGNGTQLPHTNW